MSIYSSKRKSRRVSKSHLGHLKLSVIEESSALVVHVFEARGLQRKDSGSLDTYVKLYLLPDQHKVTKEKTKIVRQKDPVFNQKFSFILGENDSSKRLFISVWTKQLASRNEMLGCMTFKVVDLLGPGKGLNGWYQVLDEIRGRSESQLVPTTISKQDVSKYEASALRGQKIFSVMVMKSPKGYGFSVYTTSPVYITQVSPGLPAANADLRVGDIILEVQGNDMRKASGDEVVEMVQKSPNTVHMIIQRDLANPRHLLGTHPSSAARHPVGAPLAQGNRSRSFLSITQGGDRVEDVSAGKQLEKHQRHSTIHSPQYSSQSYLMPEYHDNPYLATLNISPVRHQPLRSGGGSAGAVVDVAPSPDQMSVYGTLPRRRGGGGGGGEMGVLSQPAALYVPQDSGEGAYAMHPPSSGMPMAGEFSQGAAAAATYYPPGIGGPISYAPGAVYGASSRKRGYKNKTRSVSIEEEADQDMAKLAGALSQPDFSAPGVLSQPHTLLPPSGPEGVYRGSSMRHPPPSHLPKRYRPQPSSLTQQEEVRDAVGLSRTASMLPRTGSGPGSGHVVAHHYLHSNKPVVPTVRFEGVEGEEKGAESVREGEQEDEPVEWESLTSVEQKRQKALQQLVTVEQALCDELQVGMETYVLPLKSVLSDESHRKIFTGIPELAAFSSEFCAQLKSRRKPYSSPVSSSAHYLNNVADIYIPKLEEFSQVLKTYSHNSQGARQEIALCFTNEEFTQLVQSAVDCDKPTIYSVVEAGKSYTQKLLKWMMALYYLTSIQHPDQQHLCHIVEALLPLCTDKELTDKWTRDHEIMKNKQLCVAFGNKVPSFQLLAPGRVLIHEGEVNIKRKKLWLMLFSDMVVLTKRNGRILTCVESPIMLENLTIPDVNCNEPCDFQLVEVDGRTLNRLLRAPSVSAREEWVQKLRERASGSLANRRRSGEKRNYRLQDALRKQSHLLPATLAVDTETEVTAHSMAPISEAGRAKSPTPSSSSSSDKLGVSGAEGDSEAQLKRGASKRRSLFNMGRKESSAKKKSISGSSSAPHSPTVIGLHQIPVKVLKEWECSFTSLLKHQEGLELFETFLKSEFSEENIQFWLACEKFKTVSDHLVVKEANTIYEEYIAPQAPKLVNIDHQTSKDIQERMSRPDKTTFTKAQQSIYLLMARDSFVRFIKSDHFQSALKR